MWSDNDIDNAFQRLNPPEPEPTPFPLDAWLRLETQLDKAVIERAVRRRLWKFFAAELVIVAMLGLGWLLWHVGTVAPGINKTTVATGPAARLTPFNSTTTATHATATHATAAGAAASIPHSVGAARVPAAVPASATAGDAGVSSSASSALAGSKAAIATPAAAGARARKPLPTAPVLAALAANKRVIRNQKSSQPLENKHSVCTLTTAENTAVAALAAPRARRAKTAHNPTEGTYTTRSKSVAETTVADGDAEARAKETRAAGRRFTHSSTSVLARRHPAKTTAQSRPADSAPVQQSAIGQAASADETLTPRTITTDLSILTPRLAALPAAELRPLPAPLALVAVDDAPVKPQQAVSARQPRFYLGLVAAPDVSTVKFAYVESPMPNVGLTLEYRVTDRLRLNTGLLRSTKQYKARRADYDFGAYSTYLTHRYFDSVDGTCTVLDVPLNLRYDFLIRPHYRLYGSAGLSSFFMQREDYSYAYVEYNKPGYWEGEVLNANRHYLSILNLSAGYERALGARWSVLAEPYFKLPLTGVGTGKLKLTSAGVFLGVKYGF
ncbi:porin family protein [Hymenobacter rubidus]|uniref:outer membrane beta-barrel protein n=1 Tax=Hymenobacter rubidus TaxID=1441626 RepID=UPI00191DF3E6|nr:outer membrane beta-barrel protein [Hymenobacter rubidus]